MLNRNLTPKTALRPNHTDTGSVVKYDKLVTQESFLPGQIPSDRIINVIRNRRKNLVSGDRLADHIYILYIYIDIYRYIYILVTANGGKLE